MRDRSNPHTSGLSFPIIHPCFVNLSLSKLILPLPFRHLKHLRLHVGQYPGMCREDIWLQRSASWINHPWAAHCDLGGFSASLSFLYCRSIFTLRCHLYLNHDADTQLVQHEGLGPLVPACPDYAIRMVNLDAWPLPALLACGFRQRVYFFSGLHDFMLPFKCKQRAGNSDKLNLLELVWLLMARRRSLCG